MGDTRGDLGLRMGYSAGISPHLPLAQYATFVNGQYGSF